MKTKIQVWSDFVCPFCYIGKRHLEQAIKELNATNVEVELMSYELDPHAPQVSNETIYESLSRKYGMGIAEAKANSARIIQMANNVGLSYDFDRMKPANTFQLHRMLQLAKEHGKADAFTELVMKAYFTDGVTISDDAVITDFALRVGIAKEDVDRALQDDHYANLVRQDVQQGLKMGLRGVPFFVIDGSTVISGAQPISAFKEALEKHVVKQDDSLLCEGDACLL